MRGTKHERYYKRVVNTLINKEICVNPKELLAGEIIIDEGKGSLSTKIRKHFFSKIKQKEIETILVSQFNTESEKIAYLLKQAVREVIYTPLFPDDFMETMIVYIAYKFAYKASEIEKGAAQILVGQLSELKYSSCLKKLDSTSFERQIVLNKEPRARPLLEENILPMLGIKTQQLMQTQFESDGDRLDFIHKQRDFIMNWVGKICDGKVRIIWVGYGVIKDYLQYLEKDRAIDTFNFFIFGARRTNIEILDYFVTNRLTMAYPNYNFSIDIIQGKWIHKSQITDFKWCFCLKSPRILIH